MITPYLPLPILWLVMGIGLLSFNDSNRIGTWLMRAGAIVMMLFVGGLFFLELYQDGLSARALLCAMVLMIIIMFQDYGKKHESLS